jgi:glucose/arabinose dehydrogenase
MRRRARAGIAALALGLAALSSCGASGTSTTGPADPPSTPAEKPGKSGGIALKRIGSFESPVYVTGAPGLPQLLFVVEQGGRIEAMRNGHRLPRPFLDISGRVSFEGERGLLSVAFPPDYRASGDFYVYYTDEQGNIHVDEFQRRSQTRAAANSRRAVIEIPHTENSNHNGGQLQFLGDLLYFGTGDGGAAGDPPNNAQSKESLLGKLLRIDPRPSGGRPYTVPATNPFVGSPGRDEIYSYGLRNPFRFSFDTVTARAPRIAIGDVGQNQFEEVDYTTVAGAAGANFGWDAFEGFAPYRDEASGTPDPGGTVKPIFAYSHSRGGCSITGGQVVADRSLAGLYKHYVYTDYCDGALRSFVPHLGRATGDRKLGLSVEEPSSFGVDSRGHLYVASLTGPVYRLVARQR